MDGKPARVGASGDAAINYREALGWLYALSASESSSDWKTSSGCSKSFRRADALQAAPWKVIHVAGTNGKGSVCAMIDSICRAQGYRDRPVHLPSPRHVSRTHSCEWRNDF